MGAVLQTAGVAELAAEVTCCACSSIFGLAARDSATRAKFRYCSFLLLATVTCVIVLIPGLRTKLDKIPNLCGKVITHNTCDKIVGFSAVYRILFAMAAFHFILSVLTVKVTRVKSFRARFNNGLWIFKAGLIFGLTIATFYIPKKTGFFRIWMYISLMGGFMFVMFQIILVIDFGNSWSLSWAEKLETGNTKLWYCALGFTTLFMFAISFGAVLSFYAFFTHPPHVMKCHANFFYISFMTIQCIIAATISIAPSVQNGLPGAGLLQSSVVILYALYLTWNTLSSEPDSSCNPLGNVILEYDSYTGLSGEAIFGCMLTLALLIFSCTVRASTSHLGKYGLALAESEDFALATYYEDDSKEKVEKELENGNKEVLLSEYVGYNYSFFHIIMSIASLHILMVLTNWHSPEENSNMKTLVKNWVSVWVQMASSFACILMYIWFLVTPLVKRVWGPMFGVEVSEFAVQSKIYADGKESKLCADGKRNKVCTNIIGVKTRPDAKESNKQTAIEGATVITKEPKPIVLKPELEATLMNTPDHFVKRPISRNTFCTSEVNIPEKLESQKLPKLESNDSLAFSSKISKNPASHKLKGRMKLYSVDTTFTDNERSRHFIPEKIIVSKKRHGKPAKYSEDRTNTSIESLNSWMTTSYRQKYAPLSYNRRRQETDYEQLSPIKDTSLEQTSRGIHYKTHKNNEKLSTCADESPPRRMIRKIKHISEEHSQSCDNIYIKTRRKMYMSNTHDERSRNDITSDFDRPNKSQKKKRRIQRSMRDRQRTLYKSDKVKNSRDSEILQARKNNQYSLESKSLRSFPRGDADSTDDENYTHYTGLRGVKQKTKYVRNKDCINKDITHLTRTRKNRIQGKPNLQFDREQSLTKRPGHTTLNSLAGSKYRSSSSLYTSIKKENPSLNIHKKYDSDSTEKENYTGTKTRISISKTQNNSRESGTTNRTNDTKSVSGNTSFIHTKTNDMTRSRNKTKTLSRISNNDSHFSKTNIKTKKLIDTSNRDTGHVKTKSSAKKERKFGHKELECVTDTSGKTTAKRDQRRNSNSDKSRNNKYLITNSNNVVEKQENSKQDVSIVPNVIKRKSQDPDTANELLRLQWKILRTQAKIVKIQERIHKLQKEVETEQTAKFNGKL